MITPVHILCSCRNPDLWPASILVFDSIRVGFPTARLFIHANFLSVNHQTELEAIASKLNAMFIFAHNPTVHHEWIRSMLKTAHEPFFICDTDVIFWKSFERWTFLHTAMAGRRMPQFSDPVTGCVTEERLHTSLMYLDPVLWREQTAEFVAKKLNMDLPFGIEPDFVKPVYYIVNGEPLYQDTLGQACQAIGGQPFTEAQLDCYDHLHCGTISDIAGKRIPTMQQTHQAIIGNPELARGCWRNQKQYFESLCP